MSKCHSRLQSSSAAAEKSISNKSKTMTISFLSCVLLMMNERTGDKDGLTHDLLLVSHT